MSSNRMFFKGQCYAWICVFVCACGTDRRIRPFDEFPTGPGQLAEAEQSRGHQRVGV